MILAYAAIFGTVQIICTWVGTHKLMAYLAARDDKDRAERRELYMRIQSPDTATAMVVAENSELLAPIDADHDADYQRNREDRITLAGDEMPVDVPPPPFDDEADLIGVS